MIVKDILNNKKTRGEILKVSKDSSIADAVKMLVEHDTGSVAVYDGETFLGMLTFREILAAVDHHDDIDAAKCGGSIEKDGAYATPDDSVDQIRNIMTSKHIRYLPVVADGQVVDIISFYDVARSAAKAADYENRLLKQYIGEWPDDKPGDSSK